MRIGIITDIHENVVRLEHALKLAGTEKCDYLACLGDIAGFDERFYSHRNRSAAECIRLIRENCRWVTTGNHDLFAARRLPSYSDGFVYPPGWFSMPPHQRRKVSMGKVWCFEGDLPADIGENDIEYLRGLPEFIIEEDGSFRFLLSHYIYPDLTGSTTLYVERKRDLEKLKAFMTDERLSCSFSGHSHNTFPGFAFLESWSFRKAVVNVESDRFRLTDEKTAVFLPPLTGEASAGSLSVFDTGEHILKVIRFPGK